MTNMATPQHKNPCPEGHEMYNFGHHYYKLRLSEPCPLVEKKKYISFTRFTQITSPSGGGHESSCLLTLQMLHTIFG